MQHRSVEGTRRTGQSRPEPDEAPLDGGPSPQPERKEESVSDPGIGDLSFRDWVAVLVRAAKRMPEDNMPMIAQALAYATFFAIPSVLLVAVGVFTLLTGPSTIEHVINHLGGVMPAEAKTLLLGSLQRLDHQRGASVIMTIVGLVLAVWSLTGAMTSYMTAVNIAYERKDGRNFVRKRMNALLMAGCLGLAFLLVAGFLVLGPTIASHLGSALGAEGVVKWVWWSAQWPVLIVALLAAFATLLFLGPDVEHPRWHFVSAGPAISVAVWLIVSGGFAFYTAHFSSFNKTWGSLAAVIVLLMWLWLTSLALLYGAEVNAEMERSRELRRGEPAHDELQAPTKS